MQVRVLPMARTMELINQLEEEFPHAMSDVYCGVYYERGWHELVRSAVAVCDACKVTVAQIKQKFGVLTIYVDLPEDIPLWHYIAVYTATAQAATKSRSVCERCGNPARLRRVGCYWLTTLCDICARAVVVQR